MLKKFLKLIFKTIAIIISLTITSISIILPMSIRFVYTNKICSFIDNLMQRFKILGKIFIDDAKGNLDMEE